jgi:predicted XRE-type DNA-binding protein
MRKSSVLTKDLLHELYIEKRMNQSLIATQLGIGKTTVRDYLIRYDIPLRSLSESLIGIKKSAEHRAKISESKKGDKHPNFGKKCPVLGKRCWYTMPDGRVVSMRSQWEVWYAEHLREKNIPFEYEPTTFPLVDGSAYTPDFYLSDTNEYIEVKGWFMPKHREKMAAFAEAFPQHRVILADKTYLISLGIDLRRKWISEKPMFPCEKCGELFHRSYPQQRLCSVRCRNQVAAMKQGRAASNKTSKRQYRGTQQGEANNCSKLTADLVRMAKSLYKQGFNQMEISRQTGITLGNVSNIVNGKSWKHIL